MTQSRVILALFESTSPATFFDVVDLLWWYRESEGIVPILQKYDYTPSSQLQKDTFQLPRDLADTIMWFLVNHEDKLTRQQLQFLKEAQQVLQSGHVQLSAIKRIPDYVITNLLEARARIVSDLKVANDAPRVNTRKLSYQNTIAMLRYLLSKDTAGSWVKTGGSLASPELVNTYSKTAPPKRVTVAVAIRSDMHVKLLITVASADPAASDKIPPIFQGKTTAANMLTWADTAPHKDSFVISNTVAHALAG